MCIDTPSPLKGGARPSNFILPVFCQHWQTIKSFTYSQINFYQVGYRRSYRGNLKSCIFKPEQATTAICISVIIIIIIIIITITINNNNNNNNNDNDNDNDNNDNDNNLQL